MSRKGLAGPYIRAYLWPFLAALAFLCAESVCDLLQPTIMARIVDKGVAARDIGIVLRFGLLMLSVAAVGAGGATGRNIISSVVSYRFGAQLRADLFRRITSYSFRELDTFDTASLITRQTNDVTQVQAFVNGVMRIFAKAPILAVGGLVMAILLEPELSIVLAIAVPISAALITVNLVTGFPRFRRMLCAKTSSTAAPMPRRKGCAAPPGLRELLTRSSACRRATRRNWSSREPT